MVLPVKSSNTFYKITSSTTVNVHVQMVNIPVINHPAVTKCLVFPVGQKSSDGV